MSIPFRSQAPRLRIAVIEIFQLIIPETHIHIPILILRVILRIPRSSSFLRNIIYSLVLSFDQSFFIRTNVSNILLIAREIILRIISLVRSLPSASESSVGIVSYSYRLAVDYFSRAWIGRAFWWALVSIEIGMSYPTQWTNHNFSIFWFSPNLNSL